MSFSLLLDELLSKGFEGLGLKLPPSSLMSYLLLLQKWNKTYNLTASKDLALILTRHVLDSLAILPWIRGKRVLDVGTGAGFPGLPLALVKPECQFVLLDSNGKKTRFLEEVKRRLCLENIEVIQSRAESYHPSVNFDTVTSRAFSELEQMLKWTSHLTTTNGIWLAMKGRYPEVELQNINLPYQVHSYTVPGLSSERCCVIIKNAHKE